MQYWGMTLNMCQISSLMTATDGPVAEFSSFANFEERKRKSKLSMPFPKIVHQKGSFGQIKRNPLFRFCRPILDIFGLTLFREAFMSVETTSTACFFGSLVYSTGPRQLSIISMELTPYWNKT